MVKQITAICIVLLLTIPSFSREENASKAPKEEKSFATVFVQANYVAVGRYPNSDSTYSAKITISEKDNKLVVTRTVNGKKVSGKADVVKSLGGDTEVLKISWVENKKSFLGTFLIDGDLDNYARLTGYIYNADNSTKKVGLEAWFCDYGQLERE